MRAFPEKKLVLNKTGPHDFDENGRAQSDFATGKSTSSDHKIAATQTMQRDKRNK